MTGRRWRWWYPRTWRNRYGEEYEQLLEDLEAERPITWRNELDIARTGLALRRLAPGRGPRLLAATTSLLLALGLGVGIGVVARSSASSEAVTGVRGLPAQAAIGPCRSPRVHAPVTFEQVAPRTIHGNALQATRHASVVRIVELGTGASRNVICLAMPPAALVRRPAPTGTTGTTGG